MSNSNVVTLSVPKDKTTKQKVIEILEGRDFDSLVVFGIDTGGVPFVVHTPERTVPKLIVYLEIIRDMLMDEIVQVDVDRIYYQEDEEGEADGE